MENESLLSHQVGGSHYQSLNPQPIEIILAENLPFPEGSALKYIARWRNKGGIEDLKKAEHFLEFAIERDQNRYEMVPKFLDQFTTKEAVIMDYILTGAIQVALNDLRLLIQDEIQKAKLDD